ncbi:hypothetical protein J4N45_10845 [Vibrio sp. SCSIO 43140]|uniref:hypothetical protein n=1 Tax=Vibrio sp. SCSIO 43140 TaxID=2819100 RepID=UPI002075A6B4|nr:hypothetical protein [Vibrio sp. SCSIO 43140]USD59027.1 hypothetical protein J4N45_10845 [Vibrio sp. SCSIO 43140]
MKVDVYLNLHRSTDAERVYSIRSREKATYGKVIAYSSKISLRDCQFVVSAKGQARVRKEKSKLVHAVIRGTLIDFEPLVNARYVGYCPYQSTEPSFYFLSSPNFRLAAEKTAINKAQRVNCLANFVVAIQ